MKNRNKFDDKTQVNSKGEETIRKNEKVKAIFKDLKIDSNSFSIQNCEKGSNQNFAFILIEKLFIYIKKRITIDLYVN